MENMKERVVGNHGIAMRKNLGLLNRGEFFILETQISATEDSEATWLNSEQRIS